MEVILPIAVVCALVSTVASLHWLRRWQEAEERAADYKHWMEVWQDCARHLTEETKRGPEAIVPVADLYRGGVHIGRHWMN